MSKQILEVEAEEINPLEEVIEKTLVKNNVTESVINSLKEKYSGLSLKSLDDKESYLNIKEARKEVRGVGVLVEKLCKIGREDAIAVQKKWLNKEKEILAKIAVVQDPLDAEIKKFDDEVQRIENEEKERKEREFMNRQTTLLKMEAVYENNSYTLGSVSYDIANIRDAHLEVWEETILPKYKREYEKIESARAEEERLRAEEAERIRIEKENIEKMQSELRKEQDELRRQMEEIQKQKEAALELERERLSAIISKRSSSLLSVGMMFDGVKYFYSEVSVTKDQLNNLSDDDWDSLYKTVTETVKNVKAEEEKIAEEKRIAEIEAAKEAALKEERARVALEKIEKERMELEEQAKASDKEKWASLISSLDITIPSFKSKSYNSKAAILKQKIQEIKFI